MLDSRSLLASARRTLDLEGRAVLALEERLDQAFVHACELILACQGRVVVVGMGKSGHIGRKIAATLASTGTPAFFVHPGEASHGDMGMITPPDVVLALSNSGKTEEVVTLLPLIKRLGAPLISMTGQPASILARSADASLHVGVDQEACPLGLAPTSSTTATLALGDALAVALLEARGFSAEDFAFSHPGGTLGRRLLLKVGDLMHQGERLPLVSETASLRDSLLEVTAKGMGMTAVVDDRGRLSGIFTDGDLRRTLDQELDIQRTPIAAAMTREPRRARPEMLAAEALKLMEDFKINGLIVVDAENRPLGAINMHDLLAAGVL